MGCDIHCYVERRHRGAWVPVDPPTELPPGSDWNTPGYWQDWGVYAELPTPVQQLANAELSFEEIVPAVANDWHFGRSYSGFNQLAGVRGRGESNPFRKPCGLPDDISPQLFSQFWTEDGKWGGETVTRDGKTYYQGPDWHTPHWYSLTALSGYTDEEPTVERIQELVEEMQKKAEAYSLHSDDVRVVFWFDN